MLQAYFTQIGEAPTSSTHISRVPTPALPPQLSAIRQSQPPVHNSKKPSKGIKAYPNGWRKVLNGAKDIVQGSVLIKNPFPSPDLTQTAIIEAFHEVLASECISGLILEPGASLLIELLTTSLHHHKKQGFRGASRWPVS